MSALQQEVASLKSRPQLVLENTTVSSDDEYHRLCMHVWVKNFGPGHIENLTGFAGIILDGQNIVIEKPSQSTAVPLYGTVENNLCVESPDPKSLLAQRKRWEIRIEFHYDSEDRHYYKYCLKGHWDYEANGLLSTYSGNECPPPNASTQQ